MITDDRTYVVFLSTWLKKSYPKFFDKFTACLNENDIKWRFIGNTADIWCRDYMPIQIETDEFVQYRYYPDYLTKRESDKKYITNPDKACKSMYLFPSKKTDLVIDGGNVSKGSRFRHHDRKSIPRESELQSIRDTYGTREPIPMQGHYDSLG